MTAESQAAETDFAEPIEQKIDKALEPIADPHRRGKAAATILQAVSKEFYSGPLPHPSHFQRFENILPVPPIGSLPWRSARNATVSGGSNSR